MIVPKNIIFDLGGVLLNVDYSKTEDAFHELGFGQFKEMYNQYSANPLFEQLETGQVSNAHFLDELIRISKGEVTKTQVTRAWNAMLLDFRKQSLEFLEQLARKHKLFLLSNTNAIHHEAFSKIFTAEVGRASLDDYFTKAYYSHLMGLRKPDLEIFEFVLLDSGLSAGETMFIDDSYNNINAATKVGLLTHLLLPGQKIEEVLR